MRAGLSTYHIDFKYCQKMTLQMIDRLDSLLAKVSPEQPLQSKKCNLSSLRERWNSLSDFLKFNTHKCTYSCLRSLYPTAAGLFYV